jgi:MoCo/4Fe-4S cofactor protein with predicted Tat translocation signal
MTNKKYWQSFSEFNESEQLNKISADEFREDLPAVNPNEGRELETSGASRRDFLKYLGFSTAAAALAASCETPVRKAIPYVNKPQDMVPGVADYYATTYVCEGESVPVLAKVRDGRPIKIEGNNLSAFTKGGTSAKVQASVLDLYDTSRQRFPMANGNAVSWAQLDAQVTKGLSSGGQTVLLTGTITSPSAKQIIAEFTSKFPGTRHLQYDAISYSGILMANESTYGKRAIPAYHFENAKVVVSLAADFLGTWLDPITFQRAFASTRKVSRSQPQMSKFYQFESMLSMTGASADERFTYKPSESGVVAAALLSAVNTGSASGISNPKLKAGIEKAAKDLKAASGAALVVSGSNNPNIQIIVNAINEAVGANGKTIDWSVTNQMKQGLDSEFAALVADMEGGRIASVIIYDVNPAYNYFNAKRFADALKKVKTSVAISYKLDETAELCKYIAPVHHYLESWGDAEAYSGHVSLLQPTISPLFSTRQFEDSLLKWSGNTSTYEAYFRNYWMTKAGSLSGYDKILQDGVIEAAVTSISGASFNAAGVASATSAIGSAPKSNGTELVLYYNVAMGDGRGANNPWLQELPDPITKAVWDNYVMVSPKFGREVLDIDIADQRDSDKYEVHTDKPLVTVKVGNKEITLPALIVPGMNDETIAIALGYGRTSAGGDEQTAKKIGRAVVGAGKNAYMFTSYNGNTIERMAAEVSITKANDSYKLAQNQTHNSYEGRRNVIQEITYDEYQKNPNAILDERAKELEPWGGLQKFEEEGTLYGVYDKPGAKWGMSIDLNACFGCGACVVACNAENNVPVVGKNEVLRFHDMHWIRIDRYFTGNPSDADSIQTIFQPMLCQHCDNAPCENVCPVAATSHSSEGINQMIYNRCIGTRYCANNCPYKVRRFNWLDYTKADSFPDNQLHEGGGVGSMNEAVFMMNDDLTRMVLNPDVTVRSRGVMEKCSFCIQRQQEGKLKAKKENRPLSEGDSSVACAQACPANAIVFGNVNNKQSMVNQVRADGKQRLYYVLEQVHTLPNVSYLARVRNSPTAGEPRTDEGTTEGAPSAKPVVH